MNTLIVYDSQYGNTKNIALAVAKFLPSAKTTKVGEVILSDFEKLDLLIVGSPTQGGQPTKAVQQFLSQLPSNALKGIKVAAFDTRFLESNLNFALKLLVRTIGYAAPKMAKSLVEKGGQLVVAPEGFIVKNTKGPVVSGELERAEKWINKLSPSALINTSRPKLNPTGKSSR
ncbi:MAG: flavodoxin family protein [Candidatus Shapirobacteria bacterium]|jgi:flavodoxin